MTRDERRKAGLCPRCKKDNIRPVVPGRARCKECAEWMKNYQRNRRTLRGLAGKCSQCDSPPAPNKRLCEKHAEENRTRTLRRKPTWHRPKLREDQGGMCAICQKPLPRGNDGVQVDHILPKAEGGGGRNSKSPTRP